MTLRRGCSPAVTVLSIFIVVLIFSVTKNDSLAAPPGGNALIESIQQAYKDLDTFSCRFRHERRWSPGDMAETTEGTIELAKGDCFRLDTPDQIMTTDGSTLWRYSISGRQVIIENLRDAAPGILPREFLFDYIENFEIAEVSETMIGEVPAYLLELKPREQGLGVKKIRVWIGRADSITRRMEWVDETGNEMIYTLSDIEINPALDSERFSFIVPDGVTVYDFR